MKINKKILAREFVFFIICLVIFILSFLFIFPYNYITQNQSANLIEEINKKNTFIDSLQNINIKKTEIQKHFTNSYVKEFDGVPDSETNTELWNILERIVKADSVKYKWKNKWEKTLVNFNIKMGYKSPEEFTKFIKSNVINSSDLELIEKNKKEIKFLKSEQLEKQNNFIEINEQFRISLFVLLISFFILFIVRYLIYGTKWSLKVLNESQDK
ncbi:hypothetical protein M0M57_01145 [Flavobacterium azooxidireducens]|uniref:Uncharacterized protein n=1 Tax=Flavobacterium azooxidireducens TaxID=1871076 RepID=A0ABY4KF72_9FLAO|nr:hypothetical protein [Flavobacterium azooxidireducens]UPQ79457.1 hypothetical protein M0M57_01145 [Flavobacterium azooxidireducens]